MPDFYTLRRLRPFLSGLCLLIPALSCGTATVQAQNPANPPVWQTKLERDKKGWQETITRLDQAIQASPDRVELYSQRGDALFFMGHFAQAVSDYDQVITLDPSRSASHWQRGIALFYAGKYKEAAAQFDKYNTFDDVDRENGIWRYFSHYRAYGKEQAGKELLKYEKDDRAPFPSIYKLFSGEIEPDRILAQLDELKLSAGARENQEFYAQLYIGLNYMVEGDLKKSQQHLEKMLPNTWGPAAGYGPHFMWQVGRLQWELNKSPNKEETDGMGIKSSKSIRE